MPCSPGVRMWSSPTWRTPALAAAVDECAPLAARCAACVTDVADPDSVVALADDVYGTRGPLRPAVRQRRGDLRRRRSAVGAGDQRLAVVLLGERLRRGRHRPHLPAAGCSRPGTPGEVVATSSGDGGVAPVPYASVYAASKAAVSCFIEAVAHQLRTVEAPVNAHVFYPGGGLLDTGLWTAARNRPRRARAGPAPPASPGDDIRRVQGPARSGRAPGRRSSTSTGSAPRSSTTSTMGATSSVPTRDRFGDLLHARADAIADGEPCPRRCCTEGRRADMERRYTVISADTHCGADVAAYRPYLASRFHDEFDAWAATYEVPFADLPRPHPLPQLGLRSAHGRARGRRHRRRGPVPQHRPAVLRGGQPGRAAARARPTTSDAGPASRPTTAGWPISAPPLRGAVPASSRSS